MKIDKNKSKAILITSLLIVVLSGVFVYFQKNSISTIEDDLDPPQKIPDRRCLKFEDIKAEFKDYISTENLVSANTENRINLKLTEKGPIEGYKSLNKLSSELNLKDKDQLSETYIKNIEPKLKKMGLIKTANYTSFNVDTYQYKQDSSFYTISIPTNNKSEVIGNTLEIKCGEVDEKLFIQYSRIRDKYNEKQNIVIWEYTNKVLVLNVNSLNSISGKYNIYDISGKSPELIYEGQDTVSCNLLREKKLLGGINCSDD